MVTGAFVYLTWTSIRNRMVHRIRQSKNPRYALALIIGVAYFYFIFWRNPRHAGQDQVFPLLTDGGHLFVLAGLLFGAISMWLFGGDSTALAFTQAEASFLFPAPVSRRQLVAYKLIRGQLPLLFNTLIWLLLLDSGQQTLPVWARGVALWMLFCTIYLHRLGSSLVRTAWAEHGGHGLRRNTLSLAVFAAVVIGVAVTLVRSAEPLRQAAGLDARVHILTGAIAQAPARYVLWPFTALLAPVFAMTTAAWLAALPGVLVVLLVHVWWVLRTDTAFEEAALAATAARARKIEAMRGRRAVATGNGGRAPAARHPAKPGGGGIPLAPTGHPAVAIVWKNIACLRRTSQQRQLVTPVLLAVVMGFASASKLGVYHGIVTAMLVFAGAMVFMGPMMFRGDLRQDLQHLAELKTLPFRGSTIVVAEVLSVSIPLAAIQALALGAAALTAQAGGIAWGPPAMRVAIAVGVLPVLLAFNACSVTIQNGAPILFPGWSRLGTVVPGGVEMMGQLILMMGFYILLLALLLLLPVGAGVVAIITLHLSGPVSVAGIMVAGSAALAFELQGAMQLLGRAFDRLEPSSVSG